MSRMAVYMSMKCLTLQHGDVALSQTSQTDAKYPVLPNVVFCSLLGSNIRIFIIIFPPQMMILFVTLPQLRWPLAIDLLLASDFPGFGPRIAMGKRRRSDDSYSIQISRHCHCQWGLGALPHHPDKLPFHKTRLSGVLHLAIHDVLKDIWITTGMAGIVPKYISHAISAPKIMPFSHVPPNCTREQVWPNFFHREPFFRSVPDRLFKNA